MKKFKNEQKGVTLIALVITIIVLIILAGVAIGMITGENGIIRQAKEAKEQTEIASIEEAIDLAALAAEMSDDPEQALIDELNRYFGEDGYSMAEGETEGEWIITVEGVTRTVKLVSDSGTKSIEELIQNGEAVRNNTTLTDTNGDSITIPKNFNFASDSPTKVTEGMIIEDSEDNQYVWIPVFDNTKYEWGVDWLKVTGEDDWQNIEQALINTTNGYTKTYRDSSYADVWYGSYAGTEYYTNGNMTEEEYNTLYHNMLKSIYKNGGFYIGRYEMGIEVADSTTKAQGVARTYNDAMNKGALTIEGMSLPISKKNAVPYNYISQNQAQMLAEKLGEKSEYNNVTTSIMFGVQWDMVCVFIEHFDTKNTASTKSQWLSNSTYGKLWGNIYDATFKMDEGFYSTTFNSNPVTWKNPAEKTKADTWLCTTGASDQNSSLNIYDFGGNLSEWTLERCDDPNYPCVNSGGDFFYSDCASSSRMTHIEYDNDPYYSSRFSLFM